MEVAKRSKKIKREYKQKHLKQKSKPKRIKTKNRIAGEPKALILVKKENKLLYILKNNLIFIIGSLLLAYKGLLLNYTIGLTYEPKIIWYLISASMLIMCPAINHKNKFGYWYLNIVYFISTIIIYANFLYYSYSTNFLSLYQIGNLQYGKEIGEGIILLINIKNVAIFFLDNIIVAGLSILSYKKLRRTYYKNRILKIIIIIGLIILNSYWINTYINDIYESKGYNKSLIVQSTSIYYYHYEDAKDYFSSLISKPEIDEQKLENAYEENAKDKTKETEYTGIAKESNVIILQLESLNEYIIGKQINGKEIMPNLNKFFNENISCTDMYNQGLGTTADSEFEMENSLYSLENGYVFQKYYRNTWNDIYTTLRNEGYYTSFMHPNTSTYWNRDAVYHQGYHIDEYNDISKFPNIERAGDFYSDEGFLEEAVNIMNSYDKPFCTTLVSVTTHLPFHLTGASNLEEKLTITDEDIADMTDENLKNYILSCNFVDYAFGKFMEGLEETGLAQNSIIVVYGDHGSGIESDDLLGLYGKNGYTYTDFDHHTKDVHVPFAIKIPNVNTGETITRCVSKIDIKPTILDLLGVKDNFSIGTSIFSDKDYSFIKGLGFITSKYYCINDIYYDRETKEEIAETEELAELQEKMENEIYLSDTIIKNNLFAK